MSGRAGRKALGVFLLLAVGALAAGGSVAQFINPKDDPRNDKYWEAVDAACMGHHVGEMTDAFLMLPLTNYAQIPAGEPVDVTFEIRRPNIVFPHALLDLGGTLDIGNATGVQFVTAGKDPFHLEEGGTRPAPSPSTPPEPAAHNFQVAENVTEIRAVLSGGAGELDAVPDPAGSAEPWSLALYNIKDPTKRVEGTGDPFTKVAKLGDQAEIFQMGLGGWAAEVTYEGKGPDADYAVTVDVYYNATTGNKMTVSPAGAAIRPGEKGVPMTFTIQANEPGEILLDFVFFARANFVHPAGTNAQDDGHFLRFTTMRITVGDHVEFAEATAGAGGNFAQPRATVNVYNLVGRITGFIAAIVVPITMVTGGVLGKGSRKSVNVVTGGAKKRVLWHASMSFLIMGIAAVHLVLMLLEPEFVWSKGFLWGMAGLVFMGTLGVSGYYQVRIIKRWNYRTWRFMHLSAGVFVFLTMLMHTVVDGSDFTFLREDFPLLDRFIWP